MKKTSNKRYVKKNLSRVEHHFEFIELCNIKKTSLSIKRASERSEKHTKAEPETPFRFVNEKSLK